MSQKKWGREARKQSGVTVSHAMLAEGGIIISNRVVAFWPGCGGNLHTSAKRLRNIRAALTWVTLTKAPGSVLLFYYLEQRGNYLLHHCLNGKAKNALCQMHDTIKALTSTCSVLCIKNIMQAQLTSIPVHAGKTRRKCFQ